MAYRAPKGADPGSGRMDAAPTTKETRMGDRGPVPKRENERRRRNKKPPPKKGKTSTPNTGAKPPTADKDWHPLARNWYDSLKKSGQSEFYEPSDWMMAFMVAESISRDLNDQVVAVPEKTGEPVYAKVPMKGASLSAYLKAMSVLLVSEGDRRRAGIELERAGTKKPGDEEQPPGVVALSDYRSRLGAK